MVFGVTCTPRVDPYLVQQLMVALDAGLQRVSSSSGFLARSELEETVPSLGHGSLMSKLPARGGANVPRQHFVSVVGTELEDFDTENCMIKFGELMAMVVDIEAVRAEADARKRLEAQRAEHDMFCLDLRARFDVQKAEVVREADGLREDIERLKRELEDAAVTASEAHDRIGAAKVRADDYHRRLLEAQEVEFSKERAALERERYATRLLAQRKEVQERDRTITARDEQIKHLEAEIDFLEEKARIVKLKKNTGFLAMCQSDIFCGQLDDDADLPAKFRTRPEEYDPRKKGHGGYKNDELNDASEFISRGINGGFQEELLPKNMRAEAHRAPPPDPCPPMHPDPDPMAHHEAPSPRPRMAPRGTSAASLFAGVEDDTASEASHSTHSR